MWIIIAEEMSYAKITNGKYIRHYPTFTPPIIRRGFSFYKVILYKINFVHYDKSHDNHHRTS